MIVALLAAAVFTAAIVVLAVVINFVSELVLANRPGAGLAVMAGFIFVVAFGIALALVHEDHHRQVCGWNLDRHGRHAVRCDEPANTPVLIR